MKRSVAWIARGLLLATSVVSMLVVGECVVARVAPQDLSVWDNLRDGMTVHWPGTDVYLPRFGQRVQTNRIGMRDRERSIAKPPGTRRIVVLGDSFMEALQVPFEKSFPALLEARLAEVAPPVEVVNLSVSGWGTDDEVTYLARHGMALAPDGIVVMMTLHNDVADNALLEFHAFADGRLVERPIGEMPWTRYAIQKLKAYLAGHSQLYQLAYQTSVRGRVRVGAAQLDHHVASLLRRESSPELQASWMLTFALLDKAAAIAEQGGAWLAVGMIPLWVQVDDPAYRLMLEKSGLDPAMMERDGPQRRIREWAERRGILLVDLRPDFVAEHRRRGKGDELLYLPEDGHWSETGHRVATELVARALIAAGHGRPADP